MYNFHRIRGEKNKNNNLNYNKTYLFLSKIVIICLSKKTLVPILWLHLVRI